HDSFHPRRLFTRYSRRPSTRGRTIRSRGEAMIHRAATHPTREIENDSPNVGGGSAVGVARSAPRTYWIAKNREREGAFRVVEVDRATGPQHFDFDERGAAEWFLICRGVPEVEAWEAIDGADADGISSTQAVGTRRP